jgi:hypothetical protein
MRAEIRRRTDDGQVIISTAEDRRRDPTLAARTGFWGEEGRAPHRRSIVDITTRQPIQRAGEAPPATPEFAAEGEEYRPVGTSPFAARGRGTESKPLRIYPFGVSRNRLEAAINQLKVPAVIVRDPREADLVMTLKNYYRTKPQPIRDAEARGTPVYVLRSNTSVQMENVLSSLLPQPVRQGEQQAAGQESGQASDSDDISQALYEAEEAISAVMDGAPPIALRPQSKYVRRLQHQLADRYNVGSRSKGREPHRRVEIYREGLQ